MNGEELNELRELRSHLDRRFNNIDDRLTSIDERITVNAEERLADTTDLRERLDKHVERNHNSGSSSVKSGGIGAILASFVYALYEIIKRAPGLPG